MSGFINALPGAISQGLIWGILALGVFMTFRMLGISDLTVDGSMATGAAVCIMLVLSGVNPQLALLASFFAGMIAGVITHTDEVMETASGTHQMTGQYLCSEMIGRERLENGAQHEQNS